MSSLRKVTALVLLGLLTLILAGTGTGLHIHHGDNGFETASHAAGTYDSDGDSCAQHCEGETLFEHFLENHGSLFSDGSRIFAAPPGAVIFTLPLSFSPGNTGLETSINREVLPDHQYLYSTTSGRAPPFSA